MTYHKCRLYALPRRLRTNRMIEYPMAEASEEFDFAVLSPLPAMSRIHEAQSYGRDSLDIATLKPATIPIGSVTDDIPKLSTPEAIV